MDHTGNNTQIKEKKRIEIVATDGKVTRRLVWIEQSKDGSTYWGQIIPKTKFYSSYHASGKFRFSRDFEEAQWQKISEFKKVRQLANITMIRDLSKIPYKRFGLRKLDGIVYIDFRTLEGDNVHINLMLIEKNQFEHLEPLIARVHDTQIHLFAFTDPWIAISFH